MTKQREREKREEKLFWGEKEKCQYLIAALAEATQTNTGKYYA